MKKVRRIFLVIILVLLLAVLAFGIVLNINKGTTIGTLLGIEDEAYLADDNNSVYFDENEKEINDKSENKIDETDQTDETIEEESLEETELAEEIEEYSISYDEDEEIAYETDISAEDLENTPQTLAVESNPVKVSDMPESQGFYRYDYETSGAEKSKYAFSFKYNKTEVYFWQNGDINDKYSKVLRGTDNGSENYRFYILPTNDNQNGKIGCFIENVGSYNGKQIDLKCTFSWEEKIVDGEKCYPLICVNGQSGRKIRVWLC